MTSEQSRRLPTAFVVEDDSAMQAALVSALGIHGIPLRVFSSAKDFLNAYCDDWVGCLLVDVLMPDMNGFDLLREIRRRGTKLPALLMTGNADESVLQRAMDAGGVGVLEKPFRLKDLLDFIGKHCPESE